MASLLRVKLRKKAKKFGPYGLFLLIFYASVLYLAETNTVQFPTQELPIALYSNQTNDDLRHTFTKAILQAKRSITCIIYSLTDTEILEALKIQADSGIQTTVICDAIATQHAEKKLGANVAFYPIHGKGLMHNKLLVIDGTECWLGSCNFTRDSLLLHANLVAAVYSQTMAEAIEKKATALINGCRSSITPLTIQSKTESLDFHFLPDDKKLLDKIRSLLQGAQKSVKVAMFTFTHPVLIQELITLHRRGINVEIVLDSDSSRKTSKVALERFKSENMHVRTSKRAGLLHEKMAIIDDTILIGGSTNWTKAAFTSNDEHLFIINALSDQQKKKLASFWQTTLRESALCTNP